ncbi:transcriptional regulator [Clostridium chromiireducens]|uniref:transcriptional regulator n=1 Tax=Clostridium chromiireducens TaxID=225345 RepID=UPI003AF8AED5
MNKIENKTYLKVQDVKEITGVGESKAYKIIQALNKELKEKGYITIAGQILINSLMKKYYY